MKVSPPLLVEEAGERLTADLLGEVIFPPQDIVPVLLVVPLAGGDVRTLRDRTQILVSEVRSDPRRERSAVAAAQRRK